MPPRFEPDTLSMLERTREIDLETTSLDGARTHRTTIWVVTVGDQAYVRSERGTAGRWYRETHQTPDIVVHANGRPIPVTAAPAADPGTVQRVSDAFKAKYGARSTSTAAMLLPHTLETTTRLDPR